LLSTSDIRLLREGKREGRREGEEVVEGMKRQANSRIRVRNLKNISAAKEEEKAGKGRGGG
jgi:hypothetical protein